MTHIGPGRGSRASLRVCPCWEPVSGGGTMHRLCGAVLAGLVATSPALGEGPAPRPEIVMVAEARGKVVRNSEAAMVERNDGTLLAVWQEFQKGQGDSDFFPGRLVASTSADGGRTWGGYRVLVENEPGNINVFSPNLVRLPDAGL